MIILYDSEIENATITASSENPFITFDEGLNDPRTTRYGQTIGAGSDFILFSFASAIDVDYFHMFATNLTSAAVIKIQANSSDSWGSPPIDVTVGYNSLNGSFTNAFATTETYQYWRVTISDTLNPDLVYRIGNIFLGPKLVMPGITPTATIPYTSNASVNKTISGQLYGDRRTKLKGGGVAFPIIEESKRKEIETMFENVDIVKPFILLFWEDDILTVEPPLYCALTVDLEQDKNVGGGLSWSLNLEFEEVK